MDKIKSDAKTIKDLLYDLFVTPRRLLDKWSAITNQTPQVRIAYPGQHLASVVTGLKGVGTAARGNDLSDGSEVKSCSRVDQLGECKDCGERVLRVVTICPKCGSKNIKVKTDSHWIFSIKSESELSLLLSLPRILLVLFDRDENNLEKIRIRMWSVSPDNPYVKGFFSDYYNNNYKVKQKQGKTPAPCNLHPLKYDFYMMCPKLIFESEIEKFDGDYRVNILFHDLDNPKEEPMPTKILKKGELLQVISSIDAPLVGMKLTELARVKPNLTKGYLDEKNPKKVKERLVKRAPVALLLSLLPFISEKERFVLVMRSKKIKFYKSEYKRH